MKQNETKVKQNETLMKRRELIRKCQTEQELKTMVKDMLPATQRTYLFQWKKCHPENKTLIDLNLLLQHEQLLMQQLQQVRDLIATIKPPDIPIITDDGDDACQLCSNDAEQYDLKCGHPICSSCFHEQIVINPDFDRKDDLFYGIQCKLCGIDDRYAQID